MNKEIMKGAGFRLQVDAVEKGLCPFCLLKINKKDFKDKKSLDEFGISGLCQKCQDGIFK